MLQEAERRGDIEGISIARETPRTSHLLFANDTIKFGQGREETMLAIKQILRMFGQALGQEINFEKSSMVVSRNVREAERQRDEARVAAAQAASYLVESDTTSKVLSPVVVLSSTGGVTTFVRQVVDANLILEMPLTRAGRSDVLIWHYTRKGEFSVWSAYQLELQREQQVRPSSSRERVGVCKFSHTAIGVLGGFSLRLDNECISANGGRGRSISYHLLGLWKHHCELVMEGKGLTPLGIVNHANRVGDDYKATVATLRIQGFNMSPGIGWRSLVVGGTVFQYLIMSIVSFIF
ncbi:UNVERIFIED_CONTAM: hypothetical protein Slati_3837400 [Sesamum latifolium]|uniref:Reverse transcriptase domain-containing protein n=1 Tax=Sesamum latifolium TaxID=2727402 RepID=A0AAW2TJT2_9LAMI